MGVTGLKTTTGKTKLLTFDAWMTRLGTQKVASLIGVNLVTVRYWRWRKTYPKVVHMRKIRKLTKGLITYEMIIDRAMPKRQGRR